MHRTAIAAAALLLAACSATHAPEPAQTAEAFQIETETLLIQVQGDPRAFERYAAQVLTRIDTVDPALIRPGIGLWAAPDDEQPWLPGSQKLVLVGRVVAVEPRAGGY